MAVDLPTVHAEALETTRAFVTGVRPDQWHDGTPCGEWDVRSLVNHIVTGNLWAAELGGGRTIEEVGDRLDGDVLGDDPVAEYLVSAELAASTFRAPGAMERPCAVSYGPVPGEVYCGHRFIDVLIHGWDVAAATGQDATLPPDAGRRVHRGRHPAGRAAARQRDVRDRRRRRRRRGPPGAAPRHARPPRLTA